MDNRAAAPEQMAPTHDFTAPTDGPSGEMVARALGPMIAEAALESRDVEPVDVKHTDPTPPSHVVGAFTNEDRKESPNDAAASLLNHRSDDEAMVIEEKDTKMLDQPSKSAEKPDSKSHLVNSSSNVHGKELHSLLDANLSKHGSDDEVMEIEEKGSKFSNQPVKSAEDPDPESHLVNASSAVDHKESHSLLDANLASHGSDDEVMVIEEKGSKLSNQPVKSADDEAQKQRSKQKRKVRRLLRPGVIPSFVALISPDNDSGDENSEKQPTRIIVDVDEYLGLKQIPEPDAAKSHGSAFAPESLRPDVAQSSSHTPISLPADEGWYEGVTPMTLPDEHLYLNEFHHVIRSNLEFFSATASDVAMTQAGRRTPVVLGKVGIRCIHCAKAALRRRSETDSVNSSSLVSPKPSNKMWPAGSISYPVNIAGLYPIVSQKPTLHFENCPNLPLNVKTELYRITNDPNTNAKRQRKIDRKDGGPAVSTVTYYAVAAKRLGLVDSKGGIRFGRDLSLEPLSMEAALAQVQGKQTSYRKQTLATAQTHAPATNAPRITADEDSERVLAEAIAENDDDNMALGRADDRGLVSDFVFLCVKQMTLCHAGPADFATRGKKTKLMKIGFAGFCCKHCSHIESTGYVHNSNFSCRSFSSAPDNLASAISSSFYAHLQKCFLVPVEVKKALAAYKRLHSRQLSRLPHGSQRRLFHLIWTRLRAADRTEAEMKEASKSTLQSQQGIPGEIFEHAIIAPADTVGSTSQAQQIYNTGTPDIVTSETHWMAQSTARPVSFPLCKDEETHKILKAAEEEQDPSVNDNLLLASDKHLITDFIFLIMKQLRVAQPSVVDFSRGRRSTVLNSSQAGLGCKYCMEQDNLSVVSGRSFPSQPDNLASSLNTSLYQHIQKCHFVPDDMKRAIANLKRIHSLQLSNLRFGSQRRFFNLLFARLSEVEVKAIDMTDHSAFEAAKCSADDVTLARNGFIRSTSSCFVCQNCRMVPLDLRAAGSLYFERPTEESIRSHTDVCKGDSFDLRIAAGALDEIVQSCSSMNMETVTHPSFKAVVRELVGGNEQLVDVFTTEIMEKLKAEKDDGQSSDMTRNDWMNTKGLWCQFPASVDVEKAMKAFDIFANDVVPKLSPLFKDNPAFVRYFQTISPSFVIAGDREEPTSQSL